MPVYYSLLWLVVYFFLRSRGPVLWLLCSCGLLWVCTGVCVLAAVLLLWPSVDAAGSWLEGSVQWLTTTTSTFPGLDSDTSASDCKRHLVELHSIMADIEMRLTGWVELWFNVESSLRDRPLGGEVLRRNRVARWKSPSFFFFSFSSRWGSQSSLGAEFLRASLMS